MKHWKVLATLLGVLTIVPAAPVLAEVWGALGSFETSPADDDQASAGAGKIRDTRREVRLRAEVEHIWGDGDGNTDDNGLHRVGSARCFIGTTPPTILADGAADYNSTTGTTFSGEPDLDDPATNSDAALEDDVGAGRCWIDTDGMDTVLGTPDDNQLYVYSSVAGAAGCVGYDDGALASDCWVPVNGIQGTSPNMIYNPGFEATGCVSGDTVPAGWNEESTAVFDYVDEDEAQGDGCSVKVTASSGTDGLNQVMTGIPGSTRYRVVAEVYGAAADDVCYLTTSGAATDVSATDMTMTGTTLTLLEGYFISNPAAVDTVTLSLLATASGDICFWDNIGVFQMGTVPVPMSGVVAKYDSDSGTGNDIQTTWTDHPSLTAVFVPPTPGWVIQIGYTITAFDTSLESEQGFQCRLEENNTEVVGTETIIVFPESTSTLDGAGTLSAQYINWNPTPGTSLTWTVACKDIDAGTRGPPTFTYNASGADADDGSSSLYYIAYPPH